LPPSRSRQRGYYCVHPRACGRVCPQREPNQSDQGFSQFCCARAYMHASELCAREGMHVCELCACEGMHAFKLSVRAYTHVCELSVRRYNLRFQLAQFLCFIRRYKKHKRKHKQTHKQTNKQTNKHMINQKQQTITYASSWRNSFASASDLSSSPSNTSWSSWNALPRRFTLELK
jgi:hypothetical protein